MKQNFLKAETYLIIQVFHEQLHWDAEPRVGSMENLSYQPTTSRQQKVASNTAEALRNQIP